MKKKQMFSFYFIDFNIISSNIFVMKFVKKFVVKIVIQFMKTSIVEIIKKFITFHTRMFHSI